MQVITCDRVGIRCSTGGSERTQNNLRVHGKCCRCQHLVGCRHESQSDFGTSRAVCVWIAGWLRAMTRRPTSSKRRPSSSRCEAGCSASRIACSAVARRPRTSFRRPGCGGRRPIAARSSIPAAFLATTTTRLCLNALQSARARRETYVGPWLPEPVDTSADPHLGAERGEALELATVMLMEKLQPTERAAYVLREAFDYPYARIAEIVQVKEANARQLVSRARKHISTSRREKTSPAEQKRLLEALVAAAQEGDVDALEQLFADDVVSYTDGNGMRGASRIPVVGRSAVAHFLKAFAPRWWQDTKLT